MLRPYIKILRLETTLRVLIIDVLINVSNTDGRMLMLHYLGILSFFHGGHLENHSKWRVGPKISSVNILILNQGGPMNNIIPLPEGP